MAEIEKTQEEWQDQLTDEQYRVCRCGETEMPFSSEFNEFYGEGTYHCICCDTPLFSTEQQFNAGCGWPSFTAPVSEKSVLLREDTPLEDEIRRIEVVCAACEAHLGHVFIDNPESPSDLRFCINGVAMWLDENC